MGKLLIRKLSSLFLALLLAGMVGVLTGCSGDDGAPGPPGADGADGTPGAPGAPGVPSTTNESCNVCHGTNAIIPIAEMHPAELPKAIVSNIVVTSGAGATDTVNFDVFEDDGVTGIAGLTTAELRFYMADIVPEGVVTANVPVSTWPNAYLERWLYERAPSSDTVYPLGILTDNGGGNYTYQFDADLALGGADAPDFDVTDTQRLLIRVDTRDVGFNRTIGLLDFVIPADGAASVDNGLTREIVVMEACTACHNDPLQQAAHGGGYQSPQSCNICHTPIGALYGDDMQASQFWLASLIHRIHSAQLFTGAWPGNAPADFTEVKYPKQIKDCEVCHFDAGQDMADNWRSNPSIETCTTCHDVTFAGADPTHSGGSQVNGSCTFCHPATGTGVGQSVTVAHAITTIKKNPADDGSAPPSITPNYTSTLTLSPDANADGVYEAGEKILITVTATASDDYTSDASPYSAANVYVYGPRAKAVPVLTPGSTTDPAYDPAVDGPPDQGRSMLIGAAAGDPQVLTDADGFKYQTLAIPADLAPGTYMVLAYATDLDDCSGAVYRGNTCIWGWSMTTFQIGTATESLMVAGDCTQNCHVDNDWGSMFHRSYFGTDGCIACHDQSGNTADQLSNRVHAVHSASMTGDLVQEVSWAEITFPQNTDSCEACHNSGDDSYITEPVQWAAPCIGCHADSDGAYDHVIQNGAPTPPFPGVNY